MTMKTASGIGRPTLFAALSAGAKTYFRCSFSIFFFNDLTERLDGCMYKRGVSCFNSGWLLGILYLYSPHSVWFLFAGTPFHHANL